ncbi:hypothetical protein LIER_16785 [Lithospermum erythrorhizon]|uniref:Uncharacterized protein n=1 Tax=Lithospermum erythrorhizon TaxID=34254 RepID=A0AAV3Q9J8_LITER
MVLTSHLPLSQAASTSRALANGHTTMYQQTLDLNEELAQKHLKVEALEEELQGLRLQVSKYPWDRHGLWHANLQNSPLRYHRIGAAVLSDFVLNFQDRSPTLLTLANEYRQRYSVG